MLEYVIVVTFNRGGLLAADLVESYFPVIGISRLQSVQSRPYEGVLSGLIVEFAVILNFNFVLFTAVHLKGIIRGKTIFFACVYSYRNLFKIVESVVEFSRFVVQTEHSQMVAFNVAFHVVGSNRLPCYSVSGFIFA